MSDGQKLLTVKDIDTPLSPRPEIDCLDEYMACALANAGAAIDVLSQRVHDLSSRYDFDTTSASEVSQLVDDEVQRLIDAGTPPRLTAEDTEAYFNSELPKLPPLEPSDFIPWEDMCEHSMIIRYPRKRSMSDDEWESFVHRKALYIWRDVMADLSSAFAARRDELWDVFTEGNIAFAADNLRGWKWQFSEERICHHAEQLDCVVFPRSDDELKALILDEVDPVLRETWVDGEGDPLMTLLVATLGEDHKWGAEWTRRDEEYERAKSERRNPDYDDLPLWED